MARRYCYYGDELGMTNIRFTSISDYRDMSAINEYQFTKINGADTNELITKFQFSQRDNGRTPMQWNANANAGFSTGTPWINVNPNYKTINEAAEEKDPNSILNYFRKMVKLRKENPVLMYGKYTLLDKGNPNVYVYTRELKGTRFLILLNFKKEAAQVITGINMTGAKLLLDNYSSPSQNNTLQPYEAAVYQLK